MCVSRVHLKLTQMEAEGHPKGGRYSLISCESMSWVRPGTESCVSVRTQCESYFTVVLASKKVPLKTLKDYKSDLLTITPEEEALGFKYVFQTKITKDTVNERLRGPLGLWSNQETFIDNNMQLVLNRLKEYYA